MRRSAALLVAGALFSPGVSSATILYGDFELAGTLAMQNHLRFEAIDEVMPTMQRNTLVIRPRFVTREIRSS